jgi:hypothetical protein
MMADPAHIASDDALYFSNASSSPDLFDASEDPDSKGGTPQFKHKKSNHGAGGIKSTSLEPGPVLQLTPGASRIP